MHPVSDYIPAFVFMAAALAIPREGSRDEDVNGQAPKSDRIAIERATVPEVSEISKYVETLYRFEHFENPIVALPVDRASSDAKLEAAWIDSAVDPRVVAMTRDR